MNKEDDKNSKEEFITNYLKKNKNFFIKFPNLVKELNFPPKGNKFNKII